MGRHLDERLALRLPRLTRRLTKLALARPHNSPLRRIALERIGERAWQAFSSGDDEIALLLVDRDVEINHVGFAGLDIGERYRGRDGFLEFARLWRAEWAGSRITHTPEALIDLGDRVVWRVTLSARSATSGADVALTCGFVHWFADGRLVRSDSYRQWSDYVTALGLDEAALRSRPESARTAANGHSHTRVD